MNRDDLLAMVKKAGNVLAVLALFLGGYKAGNGVVAEVQTAQAEASSSASQATTTAAALAVRAEIKPLRDDMQRLAAAVDVLWAKRGDVDQLEQRVSQLELPASATAADDWRQLPVRTRRGK